MKHNFSVPQEVLQILQTLKDNSFEGYIVGGCVRDMLIGREPGDWDVTTNAKPDQIQSMFPDTFYENTFGTVGVKTESEDKKLKVVEVTPYRLESSYSDNRHPDEVTFSETLEEDLTRRDFTINAMAYDPIEDELVDLYGGQEDLQKKIIRAVGEAEDRFQEDALRMMRAVRFASQLGFAIDTQTLDALIDNWELIKHISWERIHDEFKKIIESPNPVQGIDLMQKTKLLSHIIPELEEGINCKQNGNHIYDVYEHLLRALAHASEEDLSLELRLGALFHDIGKPRTREFNKEKQDYTFYNHEIVGAKMTRDIMIRLKFPKDVGQKVVTLVRYHMFFSDPDQITLSAVRRLLARVGEETLWDLVKLRMSDRIGMGRPSAEPYRLRKFESMIKEVTRDPVSVGMLKVDGKKLMEMGEKPGPRIGYILHALLEEVLEDPKRNTLEYLEPRVLSLQMISDPELRELGEKGKKATQHADEEEVKKIQKDFKVKQTGKSDKK